MMVVAPVDPAMRAISLTSTVFETSILSTIPLIWQAKSTREIVKSFASRCLQSTIDFLIFSTNSLPFSDRSWPFFPYFLQRLFSVKRFKNDLSTPSEIPVISESL